METQERATESRLSAPGRREGREARRTLTAAAVKAEKRVGRWSDAACRGLYLQVTESGTKSWLLRYFRDGKAHAMGLGAVDLVTLAEARDAAIAARRLLHRGVDPLKDKKRAKAAQRETPTFRTVAEAYVAAHEKGWKSQVHRKQWRSTLATYAYPEIGDLPVSSVDLALVLRVLEPLWHKRPETASRLRGRLECILDYAATRGYRPAGSPNPAKWRGNLKTQLPERAKIAPTKHHAALPYKELPTFMVELHQRQGVSAQALAFTILSAARTGETIGATWDEIDLEGRTWTVPATRMKAKRPHCVMLSDAAVAILKALPRIDGCPYLFPGPRFGQPLSNMAMAELLKGMRPGLTVHGFRAAFKTWGTEKTAHAREAIEIALAHRVGDALEQAYQRGELLEKRRALMADWAEYCLGAARACAR